MRTINGHATDTDTDKWGGFEYWDDDSYKSWETIKKKYDRRKSSNPFRAPYPYKPYGISGSLGAIGTQYINTGTINSGGSRDDKNY